MKSVISVSLGSKSRDHKAILKLGSDEVKMERIGTDSDFELAKDLMEKYDGEINAFGAGGYIINFHVADRYYPLRSIKKLTSVVKHTPIVDGTGIKDTIERSVMQSLPPTFDQIKNEFNNHALVTSAVDRYGMTQSLHDAGFNLLMADFMFALGIKIRVRSLKTLNRLCRVLLPVMAWFPISWLYPTGEKQLEHNSKFEREFEKPDIIAGDFLYVKQFAPLDLTGKLIITNTTTKADRDDLEDRGVRALITTTPRIEGRSFGTNVLEAALVAVAGENRPLTYGELLESVEKYDLKPQLEIF